MSSCQTAPISTTASSASWPSPTEPVVVIACGALGGQIREIAARNGWRIELHCLPALLHNRPGRITPEAERIARGALARGRRVALAYADCGTYGALDGLCARLGLRRLPGLHCYDVLAGPSRMRALFEAEPGTYVLTDYLVRSFQRTVVAGLGLDAHPGALARLFPALPPRGLAGPGPQRPDAGRGRTGGGPVRPAAHGDRDGHQPAGGRTRPARR